MNELRQLIARIEAKLKNLGQEKSRLQDHLEALNQAERKRLEEEEAAEKQYAEAKEEGEHEFDLLRRRLQGGEK
jgi:hypothetical protein